MLLYTLLYFNAALFLKFDFKRLANKISTMLSFDHPNVMSLIGVCIDREMPLVIMPFMSKGNVLNYIRQNKKELSVGFVSLMYI